MGIKNWTKAFAVGYIAVWTGIAIGSVGHLPENQAEPYPASLPVVIFLVTSTGVFLGYAAGKFDA